MNCWKSHKREVKHLQVYNKPLNGLILTAQPKAIPYLWGWYHSDLSPAAGERCACARARWHTSGPSSPRGPGHLHPRRSSGAASPWQRGHGSPQAWVLSGPPRKRVRKTEIRIKQWEGRNDGKICISYMQTERESDELNSTLTCYTNIHKYSFWWPWFASAVLFMIPVWFPLKDVLQLRTCIYFLFLFYFICTTHQTVWYPFYF